MVFVVILDFKKKVVSSAFIDLETTYDKMRGLAAVAEVPWTSKKDFFRYKEFLSTK